MREIAGKYRSPADLARAYTEAQKALGTQANEIGQLRQMMGDRFEDQDGQAPAADGAGRAPAQLRPGAPGPAQHRPQG